MKIFKILNSLIKTLYFTVVLKDKKYFLFPQKSSSFSKMVNFTPKFSICQKQTGKS